MSGAISLAAQVPRDSYIVHPWSSRPRPGSTGSALRAVRPPNLHITPDVRRDLVYRASATGFLYRSPLAITAQAIRAILLASAMAATLVGRRPNNAVSQGRCPIPWILA